MTSDSDPTTGPADDSSDDSSGDFELPGFGALGAAMARDAFATTGTSSDDAAGGPASALGPGVALRVGARIGSLRIDGSLGEGGMGTVWAGFDEKLGREVAVKALSRRRALSPSARLRMRREARILARLDHPGICRIFDLIEGGDLEDGGADGPTRGLGDLLVLEKVPGTPLSHLLDTGLDLGRALEIVEQVADALAAAHARHVVHRDLKPDNVMITPEGRAKVLDFGISRSLPRGDADPPDDGVDLRSAFVSGSTLPDADDPEADPRLLATLTSLTADGGVLGTPRYMSPEQALGEPVTQASDLYALGLILQEAVTGAPAHGDTTSPLELIHRAAEARAEPLPTNLDPEVARLLAELQTRDPVERPTAAEARDRLRWILDRPARARRRRVLLATATLVVVAVLAAAWGAVDAWRSRRDAERQAVTARRLGEEVRSIESLLRVAHLAPPHDVGLERRQVEDRLRAIEAQAKTLGPWAAGPVAFARGRIAFALGRAGEARDALESAWNADYRVADVARTLGLAYGALYDDAIEEAQRQPTSDLRRAARERADAELRAPAVEWLRRASGEGDGGDGGGDGDGGKNDERDTHGTDPLVPAWRALYEERLDDAASLAQEAYAQEPWRYEALRLESLTQRRQAEAALEGGRTGDAAAALAAAALRLDEALDIARSDAELHLERCVLGGELINVDYRRGVGTAEAYERALPWCRAAGALLPTSAEPWLAEAVVHYYRSWSLEEMSQDPTEPLDAMDLAAAEALRRAPENAEAHRLAGAAESQRGEWASLVGDPSRPHYERALASLRRAAELDPSSTDVHYSLGLAHFNLAFDLLAHGDDPVADLRSAAAAFAEGERLAPTSYAATSMMGSTYGVMAMHALETGSDPVDLLERSIEAFERALERQPDLPAARGNLGLAYRDLAIYSWRVGDWTALDEAVDAGLVHAREQHERNGDPSDLITEGDLLLLRVRGRLDPQHPGPLERDVVVDALDRLDAIAERLLALEVAGTDPLRIASSTHTLRAQVDTERLGLLTRQADEQVERWLEMGGSFRALTQRAEIELLRAEAGADPAATTRGLAAVRRGLEIHEGHGEAWLLRARLLRAANADPQDVEESFERAMAANPWLARQVEAHRRHGD